MARFGHHPEPAIDFCVEVEALHGLAYEVGVGLADRDVLYRRVSAALDFRVGGDAHAVAARGLLRKVGKIIENGEDLRLVETLGVS